MRLKNLLKISFLLFFYVSSPLLGTDKSFLCTSKTDSSQKILTLTNDEEEGLVDNGWGVKWKR